MVIDYNGISFASLDLAVVICGNVESELESRGVRVIKGCSGEVSEEGRCRGRWFGEGMEPEADSGEESQGAGLKSEKAA